MNEQPHQTIRPIQHGYATNPKAHKSRKSFRRSVIMIVVVLVLAILTTVVVLQWLKINSGDADQVARTVQAEVAKIMIIPTEDALVSDIENADQVKSQPFFASAQNGDKVLVFASAAKIVIYRPSTHQIVNAGPIVDDTAEIDTGDSSGSE